MGRRFNTPFAHKLQFVLLIYKSQAVWTPASVGKSDGFEIVGDHLGAIVVIVVVDDLSHVETRYNANW